MQTVSRPRLSGKVAAKPSEGASVSINVRIESKYEQNAKMILTCVHRLAPIASQGSALPSECGGSNG